MSFLVNVIPWDFAFCRRHVLEYGGPQLINYQTSRTGSSGLQYSIVHLYKRGGKQQPCDSLRGISLPNSAGKIFARILRNRPNGLLVQGHQPKSQCGFRRHHGPTKMIFAVRELQEKCPEMRIHQMPSVSTLAIFSIADCSTEL
ncbi:hypothetical protein SprV_0702388000 [Sparganum proliferum]